MQESISSNSTRPRFPVKPVIMSAVVHVSISVLCVRIYGFKERDNCLLLQENSISSVH